MSVNTIEDVELEIDGDPVDVQVGEPSTPKQETPVVEDVQTEEEPQSEAAETVETPEDDASPVEESRKPAKGDYVPRTRLNEEILKKKKLREELQELRSAKEKPEETHQPAIQQPTAVPVQAPKYPQLGDEGVGDDYDALEQARIKWQSDTVATQVAAQIGELENKRQLQEQQRKMTEKSKGFETSLKAYAEKNPDYLDDYQSAGDPTWPAHVTEALLYSENGPALDHALLKDEETRERIMTAPPNVALMELGKLEASITAKSTRQAQPRQSQAPPPIPVGSGKGAAPKADDILDGYDIE